MIEYSACSLKGSERYTNEDCVMVANRVVSESVINGCVDRGIVAVVCDGVGCSNGGEIASRIVATGFMKFDLVSASASSLMSYISQLNAEVAQRQNQQQGTQDMATTATGIILWEDCYFVFNIGDSRTYEFCNNKLSLLTKDDTVENEDSYILKPTYLCKRDALTRYIGGAGCFCYPRVTRNFVVERECYFLLCSDGVYNVLSERDIETVLSGEESLTEKTKTLLNLATQKGSTDDKSLVLIKCIN